MGFQTTGNFRTFADICQKHTLKETQNISLRCHIKKVHKMFELRKEKKSIKTGTVNWKQKNNK